jgi:hypothetical protein
MDFYDYDPSLYYASEDDASSAEPKIQFEFGASASLSISASIRATHSTAQAQTVGGEHPPSDVNTEAKLWMGIAVTIFIVTVRIEALRPVLLGNMRFLIHSLVYFRCSWAWRPGGGTELPTPGTGEPPSTARRRTKPQAT